MARLVKPAMNLVYQFKHSPEESTPETPSDTLLSVGGEAGGRAWSGDVDFVTLKNKSSLSSVTVTLFGDRARIPASRLQCLLWPDHSSHRERNENEEAGAEICIIIYLGNHLNEI